MHQKKHPRQSVLERQRLARRRMGLAALASVALVGVLAVGGTVAWLTDGADPVENAFNPVEVTSMVIEGEGGAGFDNGVDTVKKSVKVKNTGDVPAYIRASVVVNWVDGQGNVLGERPLKDSDYEISFTSYSDDPKWVEGGDGYWYWTGVVPAEETTGILIDFCKPVAEAPADGYTLCVDILCSAIQAEGADEDAFPVDSWDNASVDITIGDNGILTITNKA